MVIIDIPYPANCKECKLREIFPGYNQCVVDAKRILDIHCRPAYCPIKAYELTLEPISISDDTEESERKIRILGENWTIKEGTEEEFPGLAESDGYTDSSVRTIVISAAITKNKDPLAKADLKEYKKSAIRHELIHAFLCECGLEGNTIGNWAQNEEMVDWVAIQFPKILKAFQDLDVL